MALKKGTQNAQNGTEQETNTDVVNSAEGEENTVKMEQNSSEGNVYNGYTKFVYVGPSLPNGALKEYAVLEGSYSEILQYLSEQVEKYPQIKRLIVPVSRLAEYSVKVKSSGNVANKYYTDVLSAMKGNKEA